MTHEEEEENLSGEIEMEKGNEKQEAAPVSVMQLPKSASFLNPGEPRTEADRFQQALLELKDLRSQLHQAADYCENAFVKAGHGKKVLENTKSYIGDAIVAVVDHLGNVSSKLEHQLQGNIEVMQTEQKIDCLKQRLLTCQQYAVSLKLSAMRWSTELPRHHKHYLSRMARHPEKSSGISRHGNEAADRKASETPSKKDQLALAICPPVSNAGDSVNLPNLGSGITFSTAIPVLEGPSILSKSSISSFGSYTDDVRLLLGGEQKKKSMQGINFLSFLRMSKRRHTKGW
uniref:Probable protein ABIL5 isoform X2 n=1 Tax=Elaeis guineensis var. tenera TaxID=51953 RepID=A0A6I9R4F3_ELAGV|nr:probable protein ABIL5 isoform X2 [Elaeis guineensis]